MEILQRRKELASQGHTNGKNHLLAFSSQGSFRTTFSFTDKAGQAIGKSILSDERKAQFKKGKHFSKIRGITVTFRRKRDLDDLKALIAVKLGVK